MEPVPGDSLTRQYADYGYQLTSAWCNRLVPLTARTPDHHSRRHSGIPAFEALLRQATQPGTQSYASYPYLIRDHQISYAHSAQLLQEMKAGLPGALTMDPGICPFFQDPPSLENTLPNRRRSLVPVDEQCEGSTIYQKSPAATRNIQRTDATGALSADAPYYSIIHLATTPRPPMMRRGYSYLTFTEIPDSLQNELLYAKDLYSLRLHTEMVVLSACRIREFGELRRGKGSPGLPEGSLMRGKEPGYDPVAGERSGVWHVLMQLLPPVERETQR